MEDYWSTAHQQPQTDVAQGGVDNVLSPSQAQDAAEGTTVVNFTRLLTTGDPLDWPVQQGDNSIIWAYGSSNAFGYHQGNRGQVTVNLFTGVVPPPSLTDLLLPPGFSISILTQAPLARNMALSPNGIVYVGSGGSTPATGLYAFTLDDPTSVKTLADDLDNPNGVAYSQGSLFVATVTAVTRYDDIDSWFAKGTLPQGVVLATFEEPPSTQHSWKTVKVGPDGLVYTSVNSPCNICNDTGLYGRIVRFSPVDGSGFQTVATGVRDTQGMAWDSAGNLFWTDNGPDELGNYWPPDEFNYVLSTELVSLSSSSSVVDYGFPLCYGQNEPDPAVNPSLNCTAPRRAMTNLPAHIAALGVLYYQGSGFPFPYASNFFVAAHGSWNRSPPLYSQLLFVEIDPVTAETTVSIFLRGFGATGVPTGRLNALLQLPDGSLLASDDLRGYIYQIRYVGL